MSCGRAMTICAGQPLLAGDVARELLFEGAIVDID